LKAKVTIMWKLKDGKLTRFFQAVDTGKIIN